MPHWHGLCYVVHGIDRAAGFWPFSRTSWKSAPASPSAQRQSNIQRPSAGVYCFFWVTSVPVQEPVERKSGNFRYRLWGIPAADY